MGRGLGDESKLSLHLCGELVKRDPDPLPLGEGNTSGATVGEENVVGLRYADPTYDPTYG